MTRRDYGYHDNIIIEELKKDMIQKIVDKCQYVILGSLPMFLNI